MSGYDPQLLSVLGIQETAYDFPLPIYTRYQMVQYFDDGLSLYHSQPRSLSDVAMTRLIFQIKDPQKFFRYCFATNIIPLLQRVTLN